jgi:ATP-dependent DNA helicase RecQ
MDQINLDHYDIAMRQRARSDLQRIFGYKQFRGQQEEIIQHIIAGGDSLVLMPTGGGKSLCYQIPALVRTGVGVVVSPLIALMQDQVTALLQLGIKAAYLNSSLNSEQITQVRAKLKQNQLDLLYIAPERLCKPEFLEFLNTLRIALFAIDEAHCVSRWGHDFRPDYRQLDVLARQFPQVPRIALTATADELTRQDIIQHLALDQARIFVTGFDRPNIRYTVIRKNSNSKMQLLQFIQREHLQDSGIVYCLARKKVESVANWLCKQGFTALPYHAGLDTQVRQRNQDKFLRQDGIIMVATIAFGMGIDKPNVRFVAHLDLPKNLEAYYQETGRAGRDGLPANAWLAYGLSDVINLRNFLENSESSEQQKQIERRKLETMLGFCELITCRRQALLNYFGDNLPQACGNCDTCLNPPPIWDATVAAQKALSCVYRTGQLFGVNHLVKVLLGKIDDKIKQHNHHQVSTFGIGKELDEWQWKSVYRQLAANGYLIVSNDGYSGFKLHEKSRPLLRGEQQIFLRLDDKKQELDKLPKIESKFSVDKFQLLGALRDKRRELAEKQGIPPYMIFHDSTLRDMVHYLPHNLEELAKINGVGERKLLNYGRDFLDIISSSKKNSNI